MDRKKQLNGEAGISKVSWCLRQQKGIKLVEPNENLSRSYMEEANKTLDSFETVTGKWKLIIAYYACYNAFYSILMKIGIKCEIHECSLALMGMMTEFNKEDCDFLSKLKADRIDVQYYLKEKTLENPNKVKDFVLKCKKILEKPDLQKLRDTIVKMREGDKN